MRLRFLIDEDTRQPHIFRHGVREEEVEDILIKPEEDRAGSEESRVAVGRTRSGRFLRVIYVPDSGTDSLFVVTAYDLRGKALQAFRRRMRRKPK